MKRGLIAAAAMVVLLPACGGSGSNTRTVLVDYSSDRYSNFSLYDFPGKVAVHPGTTLIFRQTWTGEPHTVTGGTAMSGILQKTKAFLDLFVNYDYLRANGAGFPDPESPDAGKVTFADFVQKLNAAKPADRRDTLIKAWNTLRAQGLALPDLDNPPAGKSVADATKPIDEAANKAFEDVPFVFPEDNSNDLSQPVAQPCYLRTGMPPKDPKKACSKAQQRQPQFDGTNSFYSSGVIPYEGQSGNTFRMQLSKNIKPGSYLFYCAVHGPLQSVEVDVKPSSAKIPSEEDVVKQARKEIDEHIKPLDELWADAADGKITIDQDGQKQTLEGPFAGISTPKEEHAAIADMAPKTFTVKAGQPIRWKMMGGQHTISFGVPPYFPPIQFLKDGTVRINPKLSPPAGGAPKPPTQSENGPDGGGGIQKIDGGTYSGNGFWSTGFIGSDPYLEYTLRIAKPGRYRYACMLHSGMVGNVVVTA
jgi:plastocyanin